VPRHGRLEAQNHFYQFEEVFDLPAHVLAWEEAHGCIQA
jgi:hypothetical protein